MRAIFDALVEDGITANERHAQERGEIRLGYRGGTRRGLDDGGALADPAVAQRVEEQ